MPYLETSRSLFSLTGCRDSKPSSLLSYPRPTLNCYYVGRFLCRYRDTVQRRLVIDRSPSIIRVTSLTLSFVVGIMLCLSYCIGYIIDYLGRRKTIIINAFVFFAGALTLALAPSYALLVSNCRVSVGVT